MTTTTHHARPERSTRKRVAKILAGLTIGVAALGAAGTADASGFGIQIPDQGYASCNSRQNTLAMTAYAGPNGNGQHLSARFSYLDEATGRWSTSNWTNPTYVRPTSYTTGGTTQIGYWTVNGVEGRTYQAWVQIARWTGSSWTYDSWVRSGHLTNLQATHTNAYGQAIGDLSSYRGGNCVIL